MWLRVVHPEVVARLDGALLCCLVRKDEAWAGLLNGAMIIALSAAFPAFLLWRAANVWPDWVMSFEAMTARDALQGGQAVGLTLLSLGGVRLGARLVRQHLALLRRQ